MSEHRPPASRSARLGAVGALVAFCAAPLLMHRLIGFPSFPRLTTWAAMRNFLNHADDAAFGAAVLLWAERILVVLYFYVATELAITLGAQVAERLGRSSLRAALESMQPRSVAIALNAVVIAALSIAPQVGAGVAAASTPVSAPERPDPAGGGAAPPRAPAAPGSQAQAAQREHVVRSGESLWSIAAAECGSPLYWRDIADLNGVQHPGLIYPGTTLRLPAPCEVPEHQAYVVAAGDTLSRIAQREYGAAGTWEAIWRANRGAVMHDGRTFTDPGVILPGWTLRLPTHPGPLPSAAAVAPPTPAAGGGAPRQVPTAPPTATPATPPAPPTTPSAAAPVPGPAAAPAAPAASRAHDVAAGHGVRLPFDLLIPPGVASGALALALLARRRRRANRPLDRPEARRADPPVIGAIRSAGTVPHIDHLAAHTEALSEILTASGHMPRVLGAWDTGESVRFVLNADPSTLPADGRYDGLGVTVEFASADGLAVATTTAPGLPSLFRDPVAWTDDLLVPVGCRGSEGWLYLPLLSVPIAVTGDDAAPAVAGMLMAAAIRAGAEDLRVLVPEGLALDAPPEGMDLPALERIPGEHLQELLAEEAAARARLLAAEGVDNFAELSQKWPGLRPAWVLVVDGATAAACAAELAAVSTLGIGALILGEHPASRTMHLEDGTLTVSAGGLGTFGDLLPHLLAPTLVGELAAEIRPLDQAEPEPADPEVLDEAPPMAEPLVRIHVLGGFRIDREGKNVPLTNTTSVQARELVAYLAVAGPATAVELREIMWPAEADAGAVRRRELHPLVSKARSWIGVAGAEDPVVHEDGTYRLGSHVWVDVVAFRSLAHSSAPADLEAALALYAGELLAGQGGAGQRFGWVTDGAVSRRDQERSRYLGAAGALAESLLEPDAARALAVLEAALVGGGGACEPLVRLAMRAEAAWSNPDGIRRRVGALEVAIGEDQVSAETRDLARSLLAPKRRAAEAPGLRAVPDSGRSATAG